MEPETGVLTPDPRDANGVWKTKTTTILVKCVLGYLGHVEQVYIRSQGPNSLSWGSKQVRAGDFGLGFGLGPILDS